ncbi:hypothetical protein [Caldiplasma sukawensis]
MAFNISVDHYGQSNAYKIERDYSYGNSKVTFSFSNVTIKSGGSGSIQYSVLLVSGGTWGTTLVGNCPSGISIQFSNNGGDPTYQGRATIYVSASVLNGTYKLYVNATGDDPSVGPATINVTVIDHSSSSPTTPVSPPAKAESSLLKSYGPAIGGGATILLFIILSILPFLYNNRKFKDVGYLAFAVSLVSSIYLITEDKLLRQFGYIHWIILIVFSAALIIAMATYILSKGKLKTLASLGLSIGSLLMSLGMILDAALGLPLTSISSLGSALGFNYLFGYGLTTASSFSVSLAFSLLLIFNGLIFSIFFTNKKRIKSDVK